MLKKTSSRRRRTRYPIHRIKLTMTYDSAEIAKLLGVHRNTVRNWLKLGLPKLDDQRPVLIYGRALKAFLSARQERNRASCAVGEFYCFRCRVPRSPWGGIADVIPHSAKTVQLKSICEACETPIHRIVKLTDLAAHAAVLDLGRHASERVAGTTIEKSPARENPLQWQSASHPTLDDYTTANVAV
jgi:hypothetical protein